MDIVAHWYNDFGLEYTRRGGGNITWYTWQWAHHGTPTGYDASRHPLLGWYRGDDPVVLDWICHWLVRYGVAAVTLMPSEGADPSTWKDPGDRYHWLAGYFTDAQNCRQLRYVLWAAVDGSPTQLDESWNRLVDRIYLRYPGAFEMVAAGRRYPVVFVFDGERLRQSLDGLRGSSRTAAFLARVAARFQAAGFAGVAIFARRGTVPQTMDRARLSLDGVLYLDADYNGRRKYTRGATYEELVANFAPQVMPDEILAVPTATFSKPPHPSRWTQAGQTPELFGRWLRSAIDFVRVHSMPNIVLVYNVSEWAEGGPGLIPNMQDRFAYLDQVRAAAYGVGTPDVPSH